MPAALSAEVKYWFSRRACPPRIIQEKPHDTLVPRGFAFSRRSVHSFYMTGQCMWCECSAIIEMSMAMPMTMHEMIWITRAT